MSYSDVEMDLQPDCFICGQQLFDDDLQNALDNGGISNDHACSACLWASVNIGQGFED